MSLGCQKRCYTLSLHFWKLQAISIYKLLNKQHSNTLKVCNLGSKEPCFNSIYLRYRGLHIKCLHCTWKTFALEYCQNSNKKHLIIKKLSYVTKLIYIYPKKYFFCFSDTHHIISISDNSKTFPSDQFKKEPFLVLYGA